jgi:NADH-quinone oxidoreductase subunit L
MLVPVAILALLSVVGGFLQPTAGFNIGPRLVENYLAPAVGKLGWEPRSIEWLPTAATLLLAGFTFWLAYYFYVTKRWSPAAWRARFGFLPTLLERKYYFDELYDAVLVRPMDWAARAAGRWIDKPVIDGAVGGVAGVTEAGAASLSVTQSGYFRNYVLVFVAGAVVAAGIVLYRAFG